MLNANDRTGDALDLDFDLMAAGANRATPPKRALRPQISGWDRDLLTLFVRNQIKVSLALPMLAILFSMISMLWISWLSAGIWLACIMACQGIQLFLCKRYEGEAVKQRQVPEWIGMLAASELLYATCWSLPLAMFWLPGNDLQHIYLIATLMSVVALRVLIANNFMPVVIAGTGLITVAVVLRCVIEAQPLYYGLAIMAIVIEIFFIQMARRLQETARDMLIFKSQREELIGKLESAKNQADNARERAETANKAKSRFLATMSHELRTPLNAIMGFSEILKSEMMGKHKVPAYKNYSSDIHHSGTYLLTLINDILDLSRIEAGRFEVEEEPVSLSQAASECLKLLSLKISDMQHVVDDKFSSNTTLIAADRRSVHQIWLNLLTNAMKFTPAGGAIMLAVTDLANGGVALSVSDTGPGIPKAEIADILGAFTRGSHAAQKAIDGAGLGLSIVNGLAKLHGGKTSIKSTLGKGTTVTVSFPPARVLDETRAHLLTPQEVSSASQRRLISVTY